MTEGSDRSIVIETPKPGDQGRIADLFFADMVDLGKAPEQAKLKAVWSNPHISSITSMMKNMTHFQANVTAASDGKALSKSGLGVLRHYAKKTGCRYCSGCTHICEPLFSQHVPIGDLMRSMMYAGSYGDPERGEALFVHLSKRNGQLQRVGE